MNINRLVLTTWIPVIAGCAADKSTAVPDSGVMPEPRWIAVGAGYMFSCGLDADGAVTCWGRADYIGTVPDVSGAVGLEVGDGQACAWDAEGAFWCWGSSVLENFEVAALTEPVRDLSTTGGTVCIQTDDGTVACAGYYDAPDAFEGHLGDSEWGSMPHGLGSLIHCFLDPAGEARCFEDSTYPAQWVAVPAGPFEQVACTWSECCALDVAGALTCGLWDPFWTDAPTQFVEHDKGPWTDIDGDQGIVCVASPDRQSACWGNDGEDTSFYGPVMDAPETPFVQIAAGKYHACGLDVLGDITCWGDDREGETVVPE